MDSLEPIRTDRLTCKNRGNKTRIDSFIANQHHPSDLDHLEIRNTGDSLNRLLSCARRPGG